MEMTSAAVPAPGTRSALSYRVFRPGTYRSALPLVVVHGNSRAAGAAFRCFLPLAARAGIPLIVPRIPARRYPAYQRLAGPDGPWSAAADFEAMLADAAIRYGVQTGTVALLGFSGGAQFAHRFALIAPWRVERLIVASAGWYTYLDEALRYPRGLATPDCAQRTMYPEEFLRIPTVVAVGERDTATGGSLRHGRRLDLQQGPERVTRALRWVDHLEAQARLRGIESRVSFALLPNTDHSLPAAVDRGGLADLTLTLISEEYSR